MTAAASLIAIVLAKQSAYADPVRAFAIQIPPGYKANRQQLEPGIFLTDILKGEVGENPQISVLSYTTGQQLEPSQHRQVNTQTLDAMKSIIGAR